MKKQILLLLFIHFFLVTSSDKTARGNHFVLQNSWFMAHSDVIFIQLCTWISIPVTTDRTCIPFHVQPPICYLDNHQILLYVKILKPSEEWSRVLLYFYTYYITWPFIWCPITVPGPLLSWLSHFQSRPRLTLDPKQGIIGFLSLNKSVSSPDSTFCSTYEQNKVFLVHISKMSSCMFWNKSFW